MRSCARTGFMHSRVMLARRVMAGASDIAGVVSTV